MIMKWRKMSEKKMMNENMSEKKKMNEKMSE